MSMIARFILVLTLLFGTQAAMAASSGCPAGTAALYRFGVRSCSPLPAPNVPTIAAAGRNGTVALAAFPGPVRVVGAYRVIETNARTVARDLVIDGLVGEDIQREGIRFAKDGVFENIAIRNFSLTHAAEPSVSPHLPEGIHLQAGSNILIERGMIAGFRMPASMAFPNGDGVATEIPTHHITIRDVAVRDVSDAGFDLKGGVAFVLDRVSVSGAARCAKFWTAEARVTSISCTGPTAVGVQLMATAGTLTIDEFVYDNPLIAVSMFIVDGAGVVGGGTPRLIVKHCTFPHPPARGTRIVRLDNGSRGTYSIDASCTP